jgi:hypothetical protein
MIALMPLIDSAVPEQSRNFEAKIKPPPSFDGGNP